MSPLADIGSFANREAISVKAQGRSGKSRK
jgi:hypothetical protein